jgi:hypothetical protein
MTPKPRICFEITKEQNEIVKELPRSYNLSEKLREALTNILESI